jgi:hypothetical protein
LLEGAEGKQMRDIQEKYPTYIVYRTIDVEKGETIKWQYKCQWRE